MTFIKNFFFVLWDKAWRFILLPIWRFIILPIWYFIGLPLWRLKRKGCIWVRKKKRKIFIILHLKFQKKTKLKKILIYFIYSYPVYLTIFFWLNQQLYLQYYWYFLLLVYFCYWFYFVVAKWIFDTELFLNPKRPARYLKILDLNIFLIFITMAPMLAYFFVYFWVPGYIYFDKPQFLHILPENYKEFFKILNLVKKIAAQP